MDRSRRQRQGRKRLPHEKFNVITVCGRRPYSKADTKVKSTLCFLNSLLIAFHNEAFFVRGGGHNPALIATDCLLRTSAHSVSIILSLSFFSICFHSNSLNPHIHTSPVFLLHCVSPHSSTRFRYLPPPFFFSRSFSISHFCAFFTDPHTFNKWPQGGLVASFISFLTAPHLLEGRM